MTSPDDARRLLAAVDPARDLTTSAADFDAIRALPTTDDAPDAVVDLDTHRRRRLGGRTGLAFGLAAVTALGGTAAAVTLIHDPATEVVGIECLAGDKGSAIIGATAADPVDKCARVLREGYGMEPAPDTVAYRLPGKALIVGPRSTMPDGAVVEADVTPDARLAELHHAFIDVYAGVGFEADRPCQSLERTRTQVDGILRRLGLTGYAIETTTIEEGATDRCVTAAVDPESRRIVLERRLPGSFPAPAAPDPEFEHVRRFETEAGRRAAQLHDRGATIDEIAQMVRATGRRFHVPDEMYDIESVTSPGTGSARLYLEMGGKDFFHIYGAG